MLKKVVLISALAFSSQAFCSVGILGNWDCIVDVHGAAPITGTFTLELNDTSGGFIRKANIKMQTGVPQIPEVVFNTMESGSYSVSGNKLTLTSKDAGIDVITGIEIMNDAAQADMKKSLMKEEIGTFSITKDGKLVILVDENRQTNTCNKK